MIRIIRPSPGGMSIGPGVPGTAARSSAEGTVRNIHATKIREAQNHVLNISKSNLPAEPLRTRRTVLARWLLENISGAGVRTVPGRAMPMTTRHDLTRRSLLQGVALAAPALALGGVSPAVAATTTIGFIYVGPKDDYGYNQAHAEAAAALKKMPGIKIVEEEKVAETADVERTMESMIKLDGAKLLFPTS